MEVVRGTIIGGDSVSAVLLTAAGDELARRVITRPVVTEPIEDGYVHLSTACYGVQIVAVQSAELAR